jgi:hypothetical protein
MHTLHAIPANLYAKSDTLLRPSLVIAHLVLELYIGDVKQLISSGVNKKVEELQEDLDDPNSKGVARMLKADLKTWLQLKHPLSYENGTRLIRVVNHTGMSLPPASETQLSLDEFCRNLVQLGKRFLSGGTRVNGAPFVARGQFQHVLPLAIERLSKFATQLDREAESHAIEVFRQVFISLKINLLPWSPPRRGTAGRPADNVVWDAWVQFGGTAEEIRTAVPLRPSEAMAVARKKVMREMQNNDPNSSWTATGIKIQDLANYLNRRTLPADFTFPMFNSDSGTEYVVDTYQYIKSRINLGKPLHHLALLIAIIFSKLCPNVFTDKPNPVPSVISQSEEAARQYLSTLKWTNRVAAKRGNTRRDLYICMVMVFILALYDQKSPLRQYYASHKVFGKAWNDKHSECLPFGSAANQAFLCRYKGHQYCQLCPHGFAQGKGQHPFHGSKVRATLPPPH